MYALGDLAALYLYYFTIQLPSKIMINYEWSFWWSCPC